MDVGVYYEVFVLVVILLCVGEMKVVVECVLENLCGCDWLVCGW